MRYRKVKFLKKSESTLVNPELNSFTLILNHLNDNELLIFRLICTAAWNATKTITGLYDNPKQFALGTSGYFKSMEQFKESWIIYEKSMVCKELKMPYLPALLFKSKDFSSAYYIHKEFPQGENTSENGRIYESIFPYIWAHNAAWLLGNIHLGRSFILASRITQQTLYRSDIPNKFSALARELTCLYEVGYRAVQINSKKYVKFSLNLNEKKNHQCNISNLDLEENQIGKAILQIQADIEKLSITENIEEEKNPPTSDERQNSKICHLSILRNLINYSDYWQSIYGFWIPRGLKLIRNNLEKKYATLRRLKSIIPQKPSDNFYIFFNENAHDPVEKLYKAIRSNYTLGELVSSPEFRKITCDQIRYRIKMKSLEEEARQINSVLPDFV